MFVMGGNVWPGDYLDVVGVIGNYWSSVSADSSYAYALYFDSGGVNPSYNRNGDRYYGFSVRCVALGSHIRFIAKTT